MRIGTLLGIAVGIAACADATVPVAPRAMGEVATLEADAVEHVTVPFSSTLWVGCANGGAGETVALSGELVISSHETVDADGGTHSRQMMRPQRITGVGATSGLNYTGTGMAFMSEGVVDEGGSVYTFVNNFRVIGQGPGNNLLVHMVVHQTTNADGAVVADVNLSTTTCK